MPNYEALLRLFRSSRRHLSLRNVRAAQIPFKGAKEFNGKSLECEKENNLTNKAKFGQDFTRLKFSGDHNLDGDLKIPLRPPPSWSELSTIEIERHFQGSPTVSDS